MSGPDNMPAALFRQPYSEVMVWVVGESDDWIEAVFTDEAAADAWASAKGTTFWVWETPLDPTESPEQTT